MARKKSRGTARNSAAGQSRVNSSAPGVASDIPTSNMRETGRVTRSSTTAPIPAARNTTSDQPSRPPPTKSCTSSANKSVEGLVKRIRDPTTDYMTGGNPGVFDGLYPPQPGTIEDEELDDDLKLMGIRPDGPGAPPTPRRPRVPARDPDVPDCDNLPVSNVRADPLIEENEMLDRILATMPNVDADDVDPARMMANMRSAAQKQNAMDWLVTHDKNVKHHSRPELSEAMKKHETEVALAKDSHQRSMAGMDNYHRNPDVINRVVFGSDPTRTQHAEQHFTAEEPAQRKKKKKLAKTTASQKDGKSKQNKDKDAQKAAQAIEVISSESDSTLTTSLPGSSPGQSSPQPDSTNLNMLAQAAELLIEPAGTQHHEEVTVQEPVQHKSSTETTALQNDPQTVQEEEMTAAKANEEEQNEEFQSTSASPHVTDRQNLIHQPGPTNLDILAQVAELRSPLVDPTARLQKPATTLSRPIAAVNKTGITSNFQPATKLPTVEAMTTTEPVPTNTNVEPAAVTGSNAPDSTNSSGSSGSPRINFRYKTIEFIPSLLSFGPPAPCTSGSGKRKQPTEVTTTDEPAAKKSRGTPITTTDSHWTAIQYDPEAGQRKRNKNKAAKQPAPNQSASKPPSTLLGKRKDPDTSYAAPPSSDPSPNPKRRRAHPTHPPTTLSADASTLIHLLAQRGASTTATAPSLPTPLPAPSSTALPSTSPTGSSNQPASPIPIPAAVQAEYDRIQTGTAAPFAAPTGGLRNAGSPLPVCGANGFRLLHAQPQCAVNQPPAGGRVVLYYVVDGAAGIQALAYGGAKAIDWADAKDVARVRRWVLQKLQRWGCDRVRADMKERAWLEEEDEVLRVEGRRLVDADPRRAKTKKEYVRELTRILVERFGGKEMEGTMGGKKQEMSVRPVRTLDGASTRCDRLDKGKFWVNLGVNEEKSEKMVAKEDDESEDADEEGQSPAAARKKGKKSTVKPEAGGKGKGFKK